MRYTFIAPVAAVATVLAGPAFAKPGAVPVSGIYAAEGLVLASSSDNTAVTCPAAVGATFTGVAEYDRHRGLAVRQSVNTATGAAIYLEAFTKDARASTSHGGGDEGGTQKSTTGKFTFGYVGSTLSTGTFAEVFTPVDLSAAIVTVTLTFPYSSGDATATCTEQDQVTLLRTGS